MQPQVRHTTTEVLMLERIIPSKPSEDTFRLVSDNFHGGCRVHPAHQRFVPAVCGDREAEGSLLPPNGKLVNGRLDIPNWLVFVQVDTLRV